MQRSGEVGRFEVEANRRRRLIGTVTRRKLLQKHRNQGLLMLRLVLLSLATFLGGTVADNSIAQEAVGGIACGVSLDLDYVASVQIRTDVTAEPAENINPMRLDETKAPITLTLIDEGDKKSQFIISVWTKSNVIPSKLRLMVINEKGALVDVLQAKVQFVERSDGQLATFVGSLTDECTSSCRIHVVQVLGSKRFCRPLSEMQTAPGG